MGVTVNTRELESFRLKLQQMAGDQSLAFRQHASKQMAARMLALVIPRTPAVSGELRRGWSRRTPAYYVGARGGASVTITNPVSYASYVEHGHRQQVGRYVPQIGKRLVNGWVEGQHFLRAAEADLEERAPAILEPMLDSWLSQLS